MRGTGCYNLAQGAVATVQGVGASLSGLASGIIVDRFGYSSAFLAAGAAACVALAALLFATLEAGSGASGSDTMSALPGSEGCLDLRRRR